MSTVAFRNEPYQMRRRHEHRASLARLAPSSDRLGRLAGDERGVSAVEFAMLLPLMLTLYLGAVEISQGIGADRKVTLTARTVADLVSQVIEHQQHRHDQFAQRGDRGDGAVSRSAISRSRCRA